MRIGHCHMQSKNGPMCNNVLLQTTINQACKCALHLSGLLILLLRQLRYLLVALAVLETYTIQNTPLPIPNIAPPAKQTKPRASLESGFCQGLFV